MTSNRPLCKLCEDDRLSQLILREPTRARHVCVMAGKCKRLREHLYKKAVSYDHFCGLLEEYTSHD